METALFITINMTNSLIDRSVNMPRSYMLCLAMKIAGIWLPASQGRSIACFSPDGDLHDIATPLIYRPRFDEIWSFLDYEKARPSAFSFEAAIPHKFLDIDMMAGSPDSDSTSTSAEELPAVPSPAVAPRQCSSWFDSETLIYKV